MGHQLIKQPNGYYAVFSSVVDNFILLNATLEELIEEEVRRERERIEHRYRQVAQALDAGESPYHQFTMTFEEACASAQEIHGEDDATVALAKDVASKPREESATE